MNITECKLRLPEISSPEISWSEISSSEISSSEISSSEISPSEISSSEISSSEISSSVITFYKTSHFIYSIRNSLLLLSPNNYRVLIIIFKIIVNSAIIDYLELPLVIVLREKVSDHHSTPAPRNTLFLIIQQEVVSTLEANFLTKKKKFTVEQA